MLSVPPPKFGTSGGGDDVAVAPADRGPPDRGAAGCVEMPTTTVSVTKACVIVPAAMKGARFWGSRAVLASVTVWLAKGTSLFG